MSVIWDTPRHPAPITQARARVIASEIPLTYRQVIWVVNQAEVESRQRASLHHWIETAPASEVASWCWEQWLNQMIDRDKCDDCDYERNAP